MAQPLLPLPPLPPPMLLTNSCEIKRIIYQANIDFDIAGYKYTNKNVTLANVKPHLKNVPAIIKCCSTTSLNIKMIRKKR